MDLSGLIFVALAVAWAGYLLPRALRQYDASGAVAADTSTDDARVLTRTSAAMRSLLAEHEPVDPARKKADKAALKASEAQRRAALKRPASRGAAVRRRRILLVLVLATAGVAGAAGLGRLPWWSVAIPGGLTAAWLLMCVLMARAERRRARAVRSSAGPVVEAVEELIEDAPVAETAPARMIEPADDPLWDPLPITLPTYVGKPVARRTARAIELTAMTSSGHDAADSALARRLRAAAATPGTAAAAGTLAAEPVEHRRAAGA